MNNLKMENQQMINLEMDQEFMQEMQEHILLQAFIGIVKKESYVELWPVMDTLHLELMEVMK